jgi:hypothetical protein
MESRLGSGIGDQGTPQCNIRVGRRRLVGVLVLGILAGAAVAAVAMLRTRGRAVSFVLRSAGQQRAYPAPAL